MKEKHLRKQSRGSFGNWPFWIISLVCNSDLHIAKVFDPDVQLIKLTGMRFFSSFFLVVSNIKIQFFYYIIIYYLFLHQLVTLESSYKQQIRVYTDIFYILCWTSRFAVFQWKIIVQGFKRMLPDIYNNII